MVHRVTDEERFKEWQRFIKASSDETVSVFWRRQYFRAVQKMFQTNAELGGSEGAEPVWDWIAGMYARDACMLVRRELDKQGGVLNLRRLLYEIEKHHGVLASRSRVAPSADAIREDREKLENETDKVREYAERVLAHRTPRNKIEVTLEEIDRAIRVLLHTMRNYHAYLMDSDLLKATPVAQFDLLAPFSVPWRPRGFQQPEDDEDLDA